jgi:energy-coupling factor transporter ATP-binding protein EcfA2
LGEQQRLLLAASSLMDPEVWILEDPWNGLDTEARVLLMDRIMRMPHNGSVVVSDVAWPEGLLEWDCHGDITSDDVVWVNR